MKRSNISEKSDVDQIPVISNLQMARKHANIAMEKSQNISMPKPPDKSPPTSCSYLFRPPTLGVPQSPLRSVGYLSGNISDLVEDHTIDIKPTPGRTVFEPSEITGRSTTIGPPLKANLEKRYENSFDEILATSRCQEVRSMGEKYRDSFCSNETALLKTLDGTMPTLNNSGNSNWNYMSLNNEKYQNFTCDEEFLPIEKACEKLLADEKSWEKEYAAIPKSKVSLPNSPKKFRAVKSNELDYQKITVDFHDFSGYIIPENSTLSASRGNFSLGEICQKQSEDIWNIVKKSSPTNKATPLLDSSMHSSYSSNIDGKTYTKDSIARGSLIGMDAINKVLENADSSESSSVIIQKLYNLKSPSSVKNSNTNRKQIETTYLADENKENILISNENIRKNLSRMEKRETENFNKIVENMKLMIINNTKTLNVPSVSLNDKEKPLTNYDEFCNFDGSNFQTSTTQFSDTLIDPYSKIVQENKINSPITKLMPKEHDNEIDLKPEKLPSRKRSRSSTRTEKKSISPFRRSKSPSGFNELRVVSGLPGWNLVDNKKSPVKPQYLSPSASVENKKPVSSPFLSPLALEDTTESDRIFLSTKSPQDYGKLSLPNYNRNKSVQQCSPNSGNNQIQRTSSQLSSGSEFNYTDKLFPVKSSQSELSWSSTKLRNSSDKVIHIKNISNKRVYVRVKIDGPGFQANEKNVLILFPNECKSITITFCPTVTGPAVGKFIFEPPYQTILNETKIIKLFGYGGHSRITFKGLQQGPVGPNFLSLGDIFSCNRNFENTFEIINRGPLTAFANITLDYKGIIQRQFASVTVTPSKVLIAPGTSVKILITFKPQYTELKKILKKNRKGETVILISNLIITIGDEPTRHRIKKIIKNSKLGYQECNRPLLFDLWSNFPMEDPTNDIESLKETTVAVNDLCSSFESNEVALILNSLNDSTTIDSSAWLTDFEDTILYRTICSEYDQQLCSTRKSPNRESLSVQPTELHFEAFIANTATLKIHSNFSGKQIFEVDSNYRYLFNFSPKEGEIRSGESVAIMVRTNSPFSPPPGQNIFLMIYTECKKLTIPVHIKRNVQQFAVE